MARLAGRRWLRCGRCGAALLGGAVAVGDLDLGTLRGAPALDALRAVYGPTARFHGGDPAIGPRLRAMLPASGLENVREETAGNPVAAVGEKLFLAGLAGNMRAAILAAGASTAGQIEALQARVKAAARKPRTVFCQARIDQVWGRRAQ